MPSMLKDIDNSIVDKVIKGSHECPRILLIEDDREDYYLTRRMLKEVFGPELRLDWIDNWETASSQIQSGQHDVYLIDYQIGAQTGLDLIRMVEAQTNTRPMILLTGHDDRKIDIEALDAGAMDYLVKGQITPAMLGRSLRYAIERKNVESRFVQMAQKDRLTGLANRFLFLERLQEVIKYSKRYGNETCALLLLDLDNFKEINDTLGHPAGDVLLKIAAGRLLGLARRTDTIARLGGDEFAIIAPCLQQQNGAAVFGQKILDVLALPYNLDGHTIYSSASVGITVFPADGKNPDQLLKNADLALYKAKTEERGSFRFFDNDMYVAAKARKSIEVDMRKALEHEEFELHFQPKIEAMSGRCSGAEVLLRWRHPKKGLVQPNDFIPVAESTGLIVPLGNWVLRKTCEQSVSWLKSGMLVPIAVNISAVQFKRSDLVSIVQEIIHDTGIQPQFLELEITESMMMHNVEEVAISLHLLHDLGITLTIDDFGTGQSSLAYLSQFPIDKLKIDRSFVKDLPVDIGETSMAIAITKLAKSLNIGVIAEGVETDAQRIVLRDHGCQELQGFFFGKPMPAKEFRAWLEAYTS